MTCVVGGNGRGKTSILEAVGILTTARSMRGARIPDLVRSGDDSARIETLFEIGGASLVLNASFWIENGVSRRKFSVNDKASRSSTDYLSGRTDSSKLSAHTVCFSPADHELVDGDPACRRDYMDRSLVALEPGYLDLVLRYRRCIDQKNRLLQEGASSSELGCVEEILAPLAGSIAAQRAAWACQVGAISSRKAAAMAAGQAELSIEYASRWFDERAPVSSYMNAIREHRVRERERKVALIGPHRDDLAIRLGKHLIRSVGSQGESRTAILSIKLGEVDLYRERTGNSPILLIDDFSSELDQARRDRLLSEIARLDLQAIVTSTERPASEGLFRDFQQLNL